VLIFSEFKELRSCESWANISTVILVAVISGVALNAYIFETIYTNHIIPNIYFDKYPTYRTTGEGRWLADILRTIFGRDQIAQNIIALLLHVVNGLMIVRLLRVQGNFNAVLLVMSYALFPSFIDYYVFSSDAVGFVLGDTLVIFAALAVDRIHTNWRSVFIGGLCIFLSISTYQPKISAAASFFCMHLVYDGRYIGASLLKKKMCSMFGSLFFAILVYFVSSKFMISDLQNTRNSINSIFEFVGQLSTTYFSVYSILKNFLINMPLVSAISILGLIIVWFYCFASHKKKDVIYILVGLVAILAIPFALNLTKIINSYAVDGGGRLFTAYAFVFFIIACSVVRERPQLGRALVLMVVFGFYQICVQQSTYAKAKSDIEVLALSRILTRVENILPDRDIRPIVVIGDYPMEELGRLRQFPNRPFGVHSNTPFFEVYRQPEIANFFIGWGAFRYPTSAEVALAVVESSVRRPWPSAQSVFLHDNLNP